MRVTAGLRTWLAGALAAFGTVCGQAADLKTYRDVYEKESKEILQSFQPKFDGLQQQYQKSLEALKTLVQGQGDLAKTKAAVAEIARFQKEKTLPASLDANEIPEIKTLQSVYVKQYTDFEKEMTTKLGALAVNYGQALDVLQKELVRAGKLDEATAVQAEKSNVPKVAADAGDVTVPAEVSPKQSGASNWLALTDPDAAKVKGKWTKALEEAQRNLLASNDSESADFVSRLLASLEQTGGASPAALDAQRLLMQKRMLDLVRKGALDSGVTLNRAQWSVWGYVIDNNLVPLSDGPVRPNRRSGAPGPGGLVLYLPFDAPDQAGVVRDGSGAGNDGRVEGAQWVTEGRMGGAYRFKVTNVDDRIVVPDSASLNAPYVTVSAWIKTSDSDGFWNRVLDKNWRKGYNLCLGGDWNGKRFRGQLTFDVRGTTVYADRSVGDGRWHHVAGTYDGNVSKLYMDGVQVKQNKPKSPGPIPGSHWDLCVGNSLAEYQMGEFLGFDGLIDEVRVYNRALSSEEISALANATTAGVLPAAFAPSAAGAAGNLTAAERIKQAKELLAQGLLTKEDYDKKVKAIVDSL